jgi:putative membrane protein
MMIKSALAVAVLALALPPASANAAAGEPNDAQIAHIAYTAGNIDIAAAKQALAKSSNPQVKQFAQEMVRDHTAVNDKALALVKQLKVTPQDNPTSQALSAQAAKELKTLAALKGPAFDKAYVASEVAYHKTVNSALSSTLIPDARNPQLKSLLQIGLKLFKEHQMHAEHLAAGLR